MAWLKTKKVKKCICGKEPKATIVYDDKMQARSWLFRLGLGCLVLAGIGGILGGIGIDELKEGWIPLSLLSIFCLFLSVKVTHGNALCGRRF